MLVDGVSSAECLSPLLLFVLFLSVYLPVISADGVNRFRWTNIMLHNRLRFAGQNKHRSAPPKLSPAPHRMESNVLAHSS